MPAPAFPSGEGLSHSGLQSTDYKLAVYYVVPADITFSQIAMNRIAEATLEMLAWFQVATGGRTWELAFPEIVTFYQANESRQYYQDHGDWWFSLLPEMTSAGLPLWSPGTIVVVWAHGANWRAAGAQSCSGNCGVALLDVELFPELNDPAHSGGTCPDPDGEGVEAWPCTPLGALNHELGHTLGLIHPADNPVTASVAGHSVMQTHWNYLDEASPSERPWGFLRSERQAISPSPFLKTGMELFQIHQDLETAVNLPVSGTIPSVNFTVEAAGNNITFVNDTQGATLHYWTFGDYRVSNAVSPTHTYWRSGTYTVTLRASNSESMMGVMTSTVVITADLPLLYLPLISNGL